MRVIFVSVYFTAFAFVLVLVLLYYLYFDISRFEKDTLLDVEVDAKLYL